MDRRRLVEGLVGAAFVLGAIDLFVVAYFERVRCERTSETFAPFRIWWSTAGVPTMTEDVQGLTRALAGGPDALVPACRRILEHADAALVHPPAPDELLQQRYHDAATDLRDKAERCANGDFYAIRPMVSDNGLRGVTQRYDAFETTERDRRENCNPP